MEHHFNVDIARRFGVNAAILLNNLQFWIAKNTASDENYHDGYYWTYNSAKAYSELFPYLSEKQIRSALKKLEDEGVILVGNYNSSKLNRTQWYAITEKGFAILEKGQLDFTKRENDDFTKRENAATQSVNCINTDNKQHIENTDSIYISRSRFQPPTVEQVREYCRERKNNVDPEQFVDHYTANGWRVGGKSPMKNWKAAVRTWERNGYNSGKAAYDTFTADDGESPTFGGTFL